MTDMIDNTPVQPQWPWIISSMLIVIVACLGLRFGTHILDKPYIYDESYITQPINDLIERGWSVDTAIDFEETKGPGMIWPYAIINVVIGHDLNDLRLTSAMLFVLGFVPVLMMGLRCGLRKVDLLLLSGAYVLLPYHAILGQLLMSEASFVLGAGCLMWVFIASMGHRTPRARVLGPIVFGIVLSILLHHRIHAVAFAGAACLTAFERDRWRSWGWWLACLLAGLSRIPLWIRWGGLVSEAFQGPHSLGVSPSSLAYLGATFTPFIGIMLLYAVIYRKRLSMWWLTLIGASIAAALSILAMPDLTQMLPLMDSEVLRFQGIVATFVRRVAGENLAMTNSLLAALMVIGLGGLGGLGAVAFSRRADSAIGLITRLAFWSMTCGWLLYLLTGSVVYDRYTLAWAVLLPLVWVRELPRWLLVLQLLGLVGIAAVFANTWLL